MVDETIDTERCNRYIGRWTGRDEQERSMEERMERRMKTNKINIKYGRLGAYRSCSCRVQYSSSLSLRGSTHLVLLNPPW
jgi:hypothetical protein